jgi:hypothetical protein
MCVFVLLRYFLCPYYDVHALHVMDSYTILMWDLGWDPCGWGWPPGCGCPGAISPRHGSGSPSLPGTQVVRGPATRRQSDQSTKYIYIQSTTVYVPSSELGLSHPLSRQRVCPFPRYQRRGGGHTRLRVRGWVSPKSDDWRNSLILCLLCGSEHSSPMPIFFHAIASPSSFRALTANIVGNKTVQCGKYSSVCN